MLIHISSNSRAVRGIESNRSCASVRGTVAAAAVGLLLSGCTAVTYIPENGPQYAESPPAPPPLTYESDQQPSPPAPAPAPNPLDQLMAPVALYPDPLISLLLPASTFPNDVVAAANYLNGGGDPGQVDYQPWDPSVRSLSHYPSVVKWMAQNETWTQSVGAAFASQPAQVMEAIQRLRELAQAAGTLGSTPQQQVVVEGSYIEIMPAQPNVIYVPAYDPQVVYVDQPYYDYNGPFFAYGPPYEAGVWLTFGCNWGGHGVVVVDRGYWGDGRSWRRDPYSVSITVNINERPHPWAFPSGRARPQAPSNWRQSPQVTNPRPFAATPPPRPPQAAYRDIRTRGPAAVGVVSSNPAAFKGRPINTAIMPHTAGPARTQQASAPRSPASPTSQYDRPATAPKPATSPAQPRYPATPPSQYERPATPAVHPATPQYSETERVAPKMEPKAPVVDEKRPVQAPPRIETEHAPTVGHAETVTRPEELHPADDKGGPHPDVKKAPKPTAPKEQPKPEEKRDDPNR